MTRTLAIIKPDAVGSKNVGNVVGHLEHAGFTVRAMRMTRLSTRQAGAFYAVHRERPFYDSLVAFMTSGPVVALVLEADDAVTRLRETIGATDPAEAAEGTIRKKFAESKERNAIHASDSADNARSEIAFFFAGHELLRLDG